MDPIELPTFGPVIPVIVLHRREHAVPLVAREIDYGARGAALVLAEANRGEQAVRDGLGRVPIVADPHAGQIEVEALGPAGEIIRLAGAEGLERHSMVGMERVEGDDRWADRVRHIAVSEAGDVDDSPRMVARA